MGKLNGIIWLLRYKNKFTYGKIDGYTEGEDSSFGISWPMFQRNPWHGYKCLFQLSLEEKQ